MQHQTTRSPRRRSRALAALISVGGLLAVGWGNLAPASAGPTWPVTPTTTIRVVGHGSGHGHGMSQYGARGAAADGLGWQKILGFYYPGTEVGTFRGVLRVLISADTDHRTEVLPADGLRVIDRRTGISTTLPTDRNATAWRLRRGNGMTRIDYNNGHRWRRYAPGGVTGFRGPAEFRAKGPVTLQLPSGTTRYRGGLRFVRGATVNIVGMDGYLAGVVPREMPASWPTAALRAQAIAARTYAAWSRAQNLRNWYQLCDTSSCQVYGGVDDEQDRTTSAVRATSGRILTASGEPAFTQFSASSGGWTAAGSQDYLPAQEDPYDDQAPNPVHDWSTTKDPQTLEQAYPQIGALQSIRIVSRDGDGQWGGRVLAVRLVGDQGSVRVSGDDLRWLWGLPSTYFGVSTS